MKPHGPIPPGFAADTDGMLLIGGQRADELAEDAGDTPLFVYDSKLLTARGWTSSPPRCHPKTWPPNALPSCGCGTRCFEPNRPLALDTRAQAAS